MSPQEKMSALWKRIPRKVFGGRMRTTTVVMCVLWLGLAMLNAQLNESQITNDPAPTSVRRDEKPDPAPAVEPSPQTSSSQRPSETSTPSAPPSSSEANRSSGQSTTTTTAPAAGSGETTTQQRTSDRQPTTTTQQQQPQQTQQPGATTSGAESTTNPSPEG